MIHRDRTLRILHISDLHERETRPLDSPNRKGAVRRDRTRRPLVLGGAAWQSNLDWLTELRPIDLICCTGDVADWGRHEEYRRASKLIAQLREACRVPPNQVFVVPGNHDVDRTVGGEAWSSLRSLSRVQSDHVGAWMAGEVEAPNGARQSYRDEVLERSQAFWAWVARRTEEGGLGCEHLLPDRHSHGRLGYRVTLSQLRPEHPPEHVIGQNTAR